MRFWIVVLAYNFFAVISWANAAYEIGRHRGRDHGGKHSNVCPEIECEGPGKLCTACYVLWPAVVILMLMEAFYEFWKKAGMNSALPPEGEHPTAKLKKDGWTA